MVTFLFVTASVIVVAGLVGLIAVLYPGTTGRQQAPRASVGSRYLRVD
jgi:hypothetical protein